MLALPLLALAAVSACTSAVAGTGSGSTHQAAADRAASRSTSPPAAHQASPRASTSSGSPTSSKWSASPAASIRPVHAGLFESDGQVYGVGMPIIIRFDAKVTDHRAFARAVRVRVNGAPATGAWDWEPSPSPGWIVEAHYRGAVFWPAHSQITVDAPLKGVSAGPHRAFDDNLTLHMSVGAAHISTVDFSPSHPSMTVRSDGRTVRTLPVSLGAATATTRTYRGTKVIEEFDREQDMGGAEVPWSVRLTNSGEFVHAAPWNSQIGTANLSHGCTNLTTADAEWFFRWSRLGDVVEYPNADGQRMSATDGFGDWNVSWSQWRLGGEL